MFFTNFKKIFSNLRYLSIGILSFLIIFLIFDYLRYDEIIKGNNGTYYFYLILFLEIIISFLFSIFISSSVYKFVEFSSINLKENSTSVFGLFLGILVSGCPACAFSLASVIGLGSIVSFLPFRGLELKLLGIIFLLIADYIIIRDIQICKIKPKN